MGGVGGRLRKGQRQGRFYFADYQYFTTLIFIQKHLNVTKNPKKPKKKTEEIVCNCKFKSSRVYITN